MYVYNTLHKRKRLYTGALARFGFRSQMVVAVEELAELIVQVSKWVNGKNRDNVRYLVDELADARIMIEQIEHNLQLEKLVHERVDYKLRKLERVLDNELPTKHTENF